MKSSGNPPSLLRFCLLMLMLVSYTDAFVIGAPRGGHVVSGTASFTQDGNLTVITAGNRSIINYTGFDIGKNEIVQFVQPGSHATVLNRVTTADPTDIFGRLESNGIVIISNPYGVFFENGSVVNVGGLVAGAGKISDADFTAGRIHFTDLNGDVRNDGVIAASNRIALMGANVLNTGSLSAAHGMAMMVSGPDVYVGEKNGNIFVQANGKGVGAASAAGASAGPSAGSITNRGTVAAPRVILGAGDLYSTAIVNSGLLQGRSIAVDAGRNGSAKIGGTLDATSAHNPGAAGKGGDINVLGGTLAFQGATLDASGAAGGGNIRVGGDLRGGGTLAHATTTTTDAATTIRADATGATGDGGSVVLWSDQATYFGGNISAHGGTTGGNGGSAEVSSRNTLYYRGFADLTATAGARGTLLLDPDDIVIDTTGAGTIPLPTGNPLTSTVPFGAKGSGTETIAAGTLETSLTAANVVLDANNNIVFRVGIAPSVALPLANDLTLDAGHSIYIGDPGTIGTGAATTATVSTAGNIIAKYNSKDGAGTTATIAPMFAMAGTSTITTTSTVTITDGGLVGATGGAVLGAISAPGGINVDNHVAASGGAIAVNGALSTTPTAANTAGGAIALTTSGTLTVTSTVSSGGSGNGAGGVIALTAGPAAGSVAIPGTVNSGTSPTNVGSTGALSLGAAADTPTITDTSLDNITASGIKLSSTGTGNGITVGNADVTSTIPLTLNASAGNIVFGGTGSSFAGNLILSTGVANTVTQTGTLTVVGTLIGGATIGAVTLNATGNSVARLGPFNTANQAFKLTDAYTTGAGLSLSGDLNTGTGKLTLSNTGAIAQAAGGTIESGITAITGAGLTLLSVTTSDTAQLSAGAGALSLKAVSTLGGGSTGNALSLIGGTFTFTGGANSIKSGTAITTITDTGALSLGAAADTPTITDTALNAISATGGIVLQSTNADLTIDNPAVTNPDPITFQPVGATAGNIVLAGSPGFAGPVTFSGAVDLGVDTTITDSGTGANGNVTFTGTVNGTQALTLTTAGTQTFGGAVGGNTALTSLITGAGPVDLNGGSITTSAAAGQVYNGAVLLGANTTLTAAANGPVDFVSTVNGVHGLTIATAGTATFGDVVGGGTGTALTSLNVSNGATNFTPTTAGATLAVTTTGIDAATNNGQTYQGAVTLGADTTLNAGTKPVDFVSTIDGAQALTVTTGGPTTFGDNVGPTTHLTSLDVSSGGTSFTPTTTGASLAVTTSAVGGQLYKGAVTLGADTTLTAGASGPVTFGSTIDGAQALTISTAGLTRFENNVGGTTNLTSLSLSGTGGVSFTPLTGSGITTLGVTTSAVGGQTYTGAVAVGADTTLTAGASGPVTFDSTIDGAHALTIATAGLTSFENNVGATTPLTSLASTGAGGVTFTVALGVTTNGAAGQNFKNLLTLGGTTTLTANNGTVTVSSLAGGGFDLTVNATAAAGVTASSFGQITNGGALLFADGTGTALFTNTVNALGLQTTGVGGVTLDGGVTTTGVPGQVYKAPVVVSPAAGTLTANNSGPITFDSTVGGSTALTTLSLVTVKAAPAAAVPGTITFGGAVGPVGAPLASLTTSTGSPVQIDGGAVTTSGAQTYGGTITLGSTATNPLTVLKGSTLTSGILIQGGGTQSLTLNFTNPVTLENGTTATAGFITLNNIDNLTSSGVGGTTLGGTLLTAGNQNFADVVTLSSDTTLTSTSGTVSANSVTGGGFALNVNAAGSTFGAISNGGALDFSDGAGVALFTGNIGAVSLAVPGSGGVSFTPPTGSGVNSLTVTTSAVAGQSYTGPATLGANLTLTANASGPVTFGSTIDGAFGLSIATAGLVKFGGDVGSTTSLASLNSTGAGGVTFTAPLTVKTTGLQNYSNTLTLGGTTTLDSTGSSVDAGTLTGGGFDLTVDATATSGNTASNFGAITNGGALVFNDGPGAAVFTGDIGATSLTSNGAGGVTFFNAKTVTTSGPAGQTYTGKLTLGGTTTLTANGTGTVAAGSVAAFNHALTVSAAGSTFGAISNGGVLTFNDGTGVASFKGDIGATSLDSTGSGGVTFTTPVAVTTTGAQTYTGTLTLGGTTTLTGTTITGAAVTGNSDALTVTASTSASFAGITGAGAVSFDGAGSTALTGPITATSLAVSNGTGVTLSGGTVMTTAGQQYSEGVTLGGDTTLSSSGNGNIAFTAAISSPTADALAVTTGGLTTFGGAVGTLANPLTSLSTGTGTTHINGGSVVTNTTQTYGGPVTLGAPTTLTSLNSGNIEFTSTLDSDATARDLTVNTGGTTIFGGLVGSTAPLASVTTDADAPGGTQISGGVTTTGGQAYNDGVTLEGDSTLKGTTLSLASFDGNGFSLTLTFSTSVTANGFTGVNNFTSNGTGGTAVGGVFSTTGFQDFENAVTLTADTTLTSTGGGAITLGSTVNGAFALSVGTAGTTTFGGAVGTVATPLTSVATTGAGEVDLDGGSIITDGTAGQSFAGPVVLGVTSPAPATTLTALGAGAGIFFGSTIQGQAGTSQALTVVAPDTVTLTGAVGTTATPLASFQSTGAAEVDIDGSSVTTSGPAGQLYQGAVVLGSTLGTPVTTLAAGTGPIAFESTLDGATGTSQALTLTTTGTTTFAGEVGVGTALASLTAAAGPLAMNGGEVQTTGAQTYNGAVTLGTTGATFASTGTGDILFKSTIDGGEDLAVTTGGAVTFTGAVGSGTALTSVTTTATNGTTIDGGAVTTTGGQLYNNAVTLASTATAPATTTFEAGTAGVDFGGTLDGNANGTQAVALSTSGTQTFGGLVGATFALASLTTDVGPVAVNGGGVTTTGVQVYKGAVTLGANGTFTTTAADPAGGAITFQSTVGGPFTLTTATSGGNTIFGPASGSVAGSLLTALTTSASGTTFFDNAALTTNGTQTYQGPVVVQSATRALSLTASGGNILFDGTLGSTAANSTDLTLATSAPGSSVTFTGAVGGGTTAPSATALNSLTVTSPTIIIDGGVVNTDSTNPRGIAGTDGTQTYNGAVTLGEATTFVGTTVGATGVIDAQGNDLTLTLSGLASVPLAGIINVHNFTSNGTGGTDITGSFGTTGFQHYANVVTLSGNATLTAGVVTSQDSISFGSTVDSLTHFSLTLATAGPITFAGIVGGTHALGSLATTGVGTTNIDGGAIATVNNQTFAGPVVLGATSDTTTLTSTTGGLIKFASTVDGDAVGTQALITSTSGAAAAVGYDAAVGATDALKSLTANGTGTTRIGGGSVTTEGGGQTYAGPVVISTAAATTLSDLSSGTLTFGSTLDSTVAGTPTLTLSTGADIKFQGPVGSTGPLGTLVASGGGTIFINGGSVNSTGSQTYGNSNSALLGAVRLGQTATLTSTGGAVVFNATVDGTTAGAQGLSVNALHNVDFDGVVGGIALASLATNASGTTTFGMNIGTAAAGVDVTGNVAIVGTVDFAAGGSFAHPTVLSGGSQSYGAAVAAQNVFLVGGGTFGIPGTVNLVNHDLNLRFGGLATLPISPLGINNFLTDGTGGTLVQGALVTSGTQTYSDAVTLVGTPMLTSGGNITFNNPVDGNVPLVLDANGAAAQVVFNAGALVGNTTALGALTINSVGGTVFGMNVGSPGIGAGKGGLNAASVQVASGAEFFDVAGATAAHPSILTTGAQTYQGAATLQQNTFLTSSGAGAISFGGAAATIDSDGSLPTLESLTLATTGAQTFAGVIGSTTPLSAMTTGVGVTNFDMTVGGAPAGVRVDGPLLTGGAVTFNESGSSLTQPSVLTLGNGSQTYGGTVTLLGAVTVLNSANAESPADAFSGGGAITFNADIVSGIPVNAGTGTPELDVRAGVGMVIFDQGVSTTGDFAPGGAQVTFKGQVGPVGIFTVLPNDLTLPGGSIDINGGSVITGGSQIYAVSTVLSQDTVLQAGGDVTFLSTLDGISLPIATPHSLDIKVGGGLITFDGLVGSIVPLESLKTENLGATTNTTRFSMVLPPAAADRGGVNVIGAVDIGTNADFEAVGVAGGTVPTILSGVNFPGQLASGTQIYRGAITLGLSGTLHQTTVLTDLAAGAITFDGTINGAADHDAGLSVDTNGDVFFNQLVGNLHSLASLATDDLSGGAGTTRFDMNLTAGGVVAGVRVAGTVTIDDQVSFDAIGGLIHPTILSGGAQTYAQNATLLQGAVLTIDPSLRATGTPVDSGNIVFGSRVDSGLTAQDLQVNTPGDEIFQGLVGYTSPLASLATDATGEATGEARFLMTLPAGVPLSSGPGGVNVTGGVTVNDGVLFQVANAGSSGSAYTASVRSGGTQTYGGPAILGATTVLASTGGNVVFNSKVDSSTLAAPESLTIFTLATGSVIAFAQPVGATSPLSALRTAGLGTTELNGGSVTTTLSQVYGQAVTLGQDATLHGGSLINFESPLDGTHSLEADAATVAFMAVGTTAPLLNLTVDAPTAANFVYPAGLAPGTAGVNVAGKLSVTGPATFDAVGLGNVVFVRTGVPVAGYNLPSAQDYLGSFRLLGSATFTDPKGGAITFHQTVDGFAAGSPSDLTVATGGTISFDGRVGIGIPLTSLTTSNLGVPGGVTAINGGSVTTIGGQTYNDAVTLGAGAALTSLPAAGTAGGDIVFASTVDSNGAGAPQALVVNTSGRTVFGGAVGAAGALASVTTDNEGAQDLGTFINGGSVTTVNTGAPGVSGNQIYNDAVTLGAGTTLTSRAAGGATTGGKIVLVSTVDSNGAATPQTLVANTSGRTIFGGAVGSINALASLTTDNEGAGDQGTFINGGSVRTVAAQNYHDGVQIGAATTLTSTTGGDVAFASTLNSNVVVAPQSLVVNTSGRTVFGGAVGVINALASVTTDNEGPQDQGTFIDGGGVKTTGAQTYNDAVALGADDTLASTAGGALVFNGTVNGAFTLNLNTGGQTIFNGVVGGATPLTGLTTDNTGAAGEATLFDMSVGNNPAGVVVKGAVTINDAVVFDVKGSSLTRPGILTLGNGFTQSYNGLATLGSSTFLVSAAGLPAAGGAFAGGGTISFNSPQGIMASGGSDLTVRAGVGTDTLTAAVNVGTLDLGGASANFRGPITLPGLLSVEPNGAAGGGTIAFSGPTLTTSGAQLYNAAYVLGSDAVLTSKGGGAITFGFTVDGAHALTVNSSGDEIFDGRVGGSVPLASLTTDDPAANVSGGNVIFNVAGSTTAAPSVTTTGFQIYHDAAILRADTVLASSNSGTLTFGSTVDSDSTATPRALTLDSANDEIFNGQLGAAAPLLSLTTDDPAANATAGRAIFDLNGTLPVGPTVTTTGVQTYNDAVLLQTDTKLASLGAGAIDFKTTVDGPAMLTVQTAGPTTFGGAVGGGIVLAGLTTMGGGAVAIDGRAVTTTGLQTYGGVTTLGADTTLTSTAAAGGIFFGTTVDSDATSTPRALTLNAAGNETFDGRVGGVAPLASLTTDDPAGHVAGGSVIFHIGGSSPGLPGVTTLGAQTYNDSAVLQSNTVLASSGAGVISFNSTVDGPFALTLDTTGNEVFGGSVGSAQPLASLTTDASSPGGQVVFGLSGASAALSVTTVGAQTYHDAVLLQTATTLASNAAGTLTFGSTIDGTFALTLNSKGDEIFDQQIGHDHALASLTTDADPNNAGGSVRFFFEGTDGSPSVTTTGGQVYHDAAILDADTALESSGGGRIAFVSTVDNSSQNNPRDLTLDTTGDAFFGGLVGAARAIRNLTTNSTGQIQGRTVLGMDLTNQTGNAAGVNVKGAVDINEAVDFDAKGVTSNNVLVRSVGSQTYKGPATLGGDAYLTSASSPLTFASTIVGPHNLTLDSGATITLGGAIGSGDGNALASLTTVGGPVALNAGTVTTTDAQSYGGAVRLGSELTTLTSTADGINFGATVDGNGALTLATKGATTFTGAVGATTPLTKLTATDGSAININGKLVSTQGLQVYGGAVNIYAPDGGMTLIKAANDEISPDLTQRGNVVFKEAVAVNNGSLLVEGRRILAESDANISVAGAGGLDLEASDVLILRGSSYGSIAGTVTLNDPQNVPVPTSNDRATIFLTGQRTLFHGGKFDMGYLQNMFSLGSITINVGNGTALLSDIAANGAIDVTAGSILLRARNADPSRGGKTGGTDDGLNFVSRTSINFGNTAIRYDNSHSSNDVANFVSTTGDVTVNRDGAVGLSLFQDPTLPVLFQETDASLTNDNFATFNDFAFQPVSGGTQTIDTAAALSGALPDQKPLDVAIDITVTAGQLEELKKLGIHPRRAAQQERLSLTSKRALFAQLVDGQDQDNYGRLQPINRGVSRLVPSDYVVVVDRMSEREVQSILTAFEELYGKNKEKAAPIGESFNTAFTDYTTEKQTGDPAGFGPFLVDKHGKYPEVDKAVRGFDNLFGYIESLGLTNKEQAKSKEHIASDLQVAGVSPEDMVKVIDLLRTKIPKDQKASSTKLPPSPPAAAPAPGATNPPPPPAKATPPLKTARQPAAEPARKTARHARPVRDDRAHDVAGL